MKITKKEFIEQLKKQKKQAVIVEYRLEKKEEKDFFNYIINLIEQGEVNDNFIRDVNSFEEKSNKIKINNSNLYFYSGDKFYKHNDYLIKFNLNGDNVYTSFIAYKNIDHKIIYP